MSLKHKLAHKEPDTVRLAYNRAEYMEERRQLVQKWANYLLIFQILLNNI